MLRKVLLAMVAFVALFVCGCSASLAIDPDTLQKEKDYLLQGYFTAMVLEKCEPLGVPDSFVKETQDMVSLVEQTSDIPPDQRSIVKDLAQKNADELFKESNTDEINRACKIMILYAISVLGVETMDMNETE